MTHITDLEATGRSRLYTQRYRKQWSAAGFKQRSVMVHDEDQDEVAATVEALRFTRLLRLVKADDDEAISMAATRNCSKLPLRRGLTELNSVVRSSAVAADVKQRVQSIVEGAKRHVEQFELNSTYFDKADASSDPDKLRALMVCHSNLAAAANKLAQAVFVNHGGKING